METISAADKENQRKNKPRAGSVPPRSTTPSSSHGSRPPRSADSTTSVKPTLSMASGPNKRAKLTSSASSSGHRSNKGQHENHALTHRAPFGSRAGALNASHDTDSILVTTHKANKTPNVNSSLPRPVSGSKTHAPPVPHMSHGSRSGNYGPGGIGLGHASSSHRVLSATASMTSGLYSSIRHASQQAQRQDISTQKLQPKRSARNSRRESFRPRQSVDGGPSWAPTEHMTSRFGAFASQAVKEEDEY